MKAQPMIEVRDVVAASRWYCTLLGCTSGHGGDEYDRVMAGDEFVLQLHAWGAHHHDHMGDPTQPVGNGVLVWFQIDDFDAAVARARALDATILREPHVNPNAQQHEIWLRDLDGYKVVLASAPLPG